MNWRSRLAAFCVLTLCWFVHFKLSQLLPNTPESMLASHGSAFTIDLFLIYAIPHLLDGRVCDDMQILCLGSIVANFAGWICYLAYVSPDYYNNLMLLLAFVQVLRLVIVTDDDTDDTDNKRVHLVRNSRRGGTAIYS